MANLKYNRGRMLEYRTMEKLAEIGEIPFRMAGSHGLCDVITICKSHVRLVQVKSGSASMSPAERESFALLRCPKGTIKQIWSWKKIKGKWEVMVKEI